VRPDQIPTASKLATDPADEPDSTHSTNPVSEQPPWPEGPFPSGEDQDGWVPA
jgi:hypothetical protein